MSNNSFCTLKVCQCGMMQFYNKKFPNWRTIYSDGLLAQHWHHWADNELYYVKKELIILKILTYIVKCYNIKRLWT